MLRKYKFSVIVIFSIAVLNVCEGKSKKNHPPHCTQVIKDTDYTSKFRFDYNPAYLIPGQHEAYQKLYCINPPTVKRAVTVVCDWVAPPLVQYTLGDEFVHVVRVDPTGRFQGNAVITTYQFCNHNTVNETNEIFIREINEIGQSNLDKKSEPMITEY